MASGRQGRTSKMKRCDKVLACRYLRERGYTLKRIAENVDVSVATASLYCKGVLPKGRWAQDSRKEHNKEVLQNLYNEGCLYQKYLGKQACLHLRCMIGAGKRACQNSRSVYMNDNLREKIRSKMTSDPDGVKAMTAAQLYTEDELSTLDIAARLGVTSVTVSQWLEQRGVGRRKHPTHRTRKNSVWPTPAKKGTTGKAGLHPRNSGSEIRLR